MGPIDYSSQVQAPFQAALQGYQAGAAIRDDQLQQQALIAQRQAQQQQQADLAALVANPNAGPRDYAAMTLKYPALREQFKQSFGMLNEGQQQGELKFATQAYAAILSGRPDLAEQLVRTRADSMRSGGASPREVQQTELWADMLKTSPEQARHLGGLMLAGVMGPEKFTETFGKLGAEARAEQLQPSAVRQGSAAADKAEADAKTAAVTAKYAEPTVLKDLELKGWNVENIKSEIGYRKEANRIAAMNAAANRESNELKRQELRLKIQEAESKLGESARAKVADVESATSSMDNLINTVDRLKKNPGLKDVVGSLEGADWYPNQLAAASTVVSPYGLVASSGDDRADAIALIETLKSQAFLAMAPSLKGMGALSNAEGEKLQAGLQNLSRKQSEKQFNANLDEVQRLVLKARKNVETRYGIKAGVPDTPAVQTSPQQIDDLVSKYLSPKPPGAR